jgi:hypothetical protein
LVLVLWGAWVGPAAGQDGCFDYAGAGWEPAGGLTLPGGARALADAGDGLVLVGSDNGLYVVDVSRPDAPLVTDYRSLGSSVLLVASRDGLVVVVTGDDRLLTGVLGDDGRIAWSGGLVLQYATRLALADGVVAVLQGNSQLATVDVSDPKTPVYLGWTALTEAANDLALDRGLAFVASESRFLVVYDLADPASPQLVGAAARFASGTGLAVEYPRVHVANVAKIVTYDASVPGDLVELGESSRLLGFNRLVAAGRGLCFTASDQGHLTQLVTFPDSGAVARGHTLVDQAPAGLAVSGGHVVTVLPDGTLQVFDPAAGVFAPVAREVADGFPTHARVAADLLYALDADQEPNPALTVTTLQPDGPGVMLGALPFFGVPKGLDARGDRLILATSLTSLALVDISDPARPAYVSQRGQDVSTDDLAILGNSFCALGRDTFGDETLVVYDQAANGGLQLATALRMPYGTVQVEGWRDHALIRGRFELNGLLVVDCRDPRGATIVDWTGLPGDTVDLVADGRHAYVLAAEGRVDVVSLEDPSRLTVVHSVSLGVPTPQGTMAVTGKRLLVADTYRGVTVVDITSPTAASVTGGAWAPMTGRLLAGSSTVLVSDPSFNQRSYLPGVCGALAAAGNPPALRALRLDAHPNPFNPRTDLVFELPAAAGVDLAIYDVQGRLVRHLLAHSPRPGGRQRVGWDGRDGEGRPLASGVYLARIRAAGALGRAKLVLVR